jgi:hypothetical protein
MGISDSVQDIVERLEESGVAVRRVCLQSDVRVEKGGREGWVKHEGSRW